MKTGLKFGVTSCATVEKIGYALPALIKELKLRKAGFGSVEKLLESLFLEVEVRRLVDR